MSEDGSTPGFRTPHSALRIAVIGGGVSGLAAAHRLGTLTRESDRPAEIVLFEACDRTGGVVGTERIGEYLVEIGADMFITDKPWAIELVEELGLADRLISPDPTFRRSLVLRRGKPQPVPEGFTLLAPAKIWPILTSPVFSPWGKLRMGTEYLRPRRTDAGDESLASFVRRRFGNELLERLVQPLVGGIYTADPEKLSLRATLPRFLEMEREHGSLIRASRRRKPSGRPGESGARYGLFVSFPNGIRELLDALRASVASMAEIRSGIRVSGVEKTDFGYHLRTPDQERSTWNAHFDAVIVATPSYLAADLLADVDAQLAESLRGIDYASSAVVCSGHRLADVEHPLDAFGLVVPHVERRKIMAVSFTSRKFPGRAPEGHVLLRTFVGGAMQPELMQHSDDEFAALVRDELRDILGIRGTPDFERVVRWERKMPQYHVGHLDRIAAIEAQLADHPGLQLAGNAYRGVGIPDVIHSGRTAAERVLATPTPHVEANGQAC